jgi:hypothetical protein
MNGIFGKPIDEQIRIQSDLVRNLKKEKADKLKVFSIFINSFNI